MSDVDVAIIGAGPYGLSLAAHLSAADLSYRHFGVPMRLWRGAMPKGMFLKSQGFASNFSDPQGTHTLEAFCQATRQPYKGYGLPVSLENFVNYGQWFQSELDLKVEEVLVSGIVQRTDGFELTLADGEQFVARRVVVRSVTRSTTPVTLLTVISSPIVYCPSASRNSPLSRSLTIVWAPKPTAKPSTPAEASRAPVSTPRAEKALMIPTPTTTAAAR